MWGRDGKAGWGCQEQGFPSKEGSKRLLEDGENGRDLLSKDQEDRRKWRGDPE